MPHLIKFSLGLIYNQFEERLEIQSVGDDILSKFVPTHVNIFYCFGGIVLTSFILQVIIGFILTLYYRLTVLEVYSSVIYLLYNINLG